MDTYDMNREARLKKVQEILQKEKIDGWLLFDFHRSNELTHQFLGSPEGSLFTRRFFYWIPASGEPIRIQHKIEPLSSQGWPGKVEKYLSWQSLHEVLGKVLKGKKKIAMEYSPDCAIPYVSKIDGGTLDLIRSFGVEVVSSGNFLPYFTAVLDEKQIESHIQAGDFLNQLVFQMWEWIGKHLKEDKKITEYDVVQKMLQEIEENGYVTEETPICGVNANSADPHYLPTSEGAEQIHKGNFILIDVWCKKKEPRSVFADITRVGFAGARASKRQEKIFRLVRHAQLACIDLIKERYAQKKPVAGWEADDACRKVIEAAAMVSISPIVPGIALKKTFTEVERISTI